MVFNKFDDIDIDSTNEYWNLSLCDDQLPEIDFSREERLIDVVVVHRVQNMNLVDTDSENEHREEHTRPRSSHFPLENSKVQSSCLVKIPSADKLDNLTKQNQQEKDPRAAFGENFGDAVLGMSKRFLISKDKMDVYKYKEEQDNNADNVKLGDFLKNASKRFLVDKEEICTSKNKSTDGNLNKQNTFQKHQRLNHAASNEDLRTFVKEVSNRFLIQPEKNTIESRAGIQNHSIDNREIGLKPYSSSKKNIWKMVSDRFLSTEKVIPEKQENKIDNHPSKSDRDKSFSSMLYHDQRSDPSQTRNKSKMISHKKEIGSLIYGQQNTYEL